MTAINVKLPDSLAKKAREFAKHDGVSMDQFVSLAIAEKLSVWLTVGYVAERARRATRRKFHSALAQVPDLEPAAGDKF